MTFIKLTEYDTVSPVYVQPSFIVKFHQYGIKSPVTRIRLSNGEKIDVKESPEDLMDLLNMIVVGTEIEAI